MPRILLSLSLLGLCNFLGSQVSPVFLTDLDNALAETSGLIFRNGRVITINDSGGQATLYETDSTTGDVLRDVSVTNALNIDWEALTFDSAYLYIGDFGNNAGNRTNLRVYRVAWTDYDLPGDSVTADIIDFHYADQTNFANQSFTTNFDCEAFIARNDTLLLFTKNWGNSGCNIYSLPTTLGNQTATRIDSFLVQTLVTDACYNPVSEQVVMVAYGPLMAEVVKLNGLFNGGPLSVMKQNLGFSPAAQVEGIARFLIGAPNTYLFSNEAGFGYNASIYRLNCNPVVTDLENKGLPEGVGIFPNPAKNMITLSDGIERNMVLYNALGQEMSSVRSDHMAIDHLPRGIYFLRLNEHQYTYRVILSP